MHLRQLLTETHAYMPPRHALEGLSSDLAERRPSPRLHSIAEIVAHLTFWQAWFLKRCDGIAEAMPQQARDGWPPVAQGSWPELQARFLADLDRAASLPDRGDVDRRIEPPIEFPPLAQFTVRDALTHLATHNAHHLGQAITLRQMLEAWPPPQGSWTW
jgi:uncharacterized damage-inducible protein DinB